MARPVRPAGPILLTYEDYCALPDDGKRYEILEGVLCVTPAPTTRHQRVLRRLLMALLSVHAEANGLGEIFCAPIDVVLSPHNVLQPDIVFVGEKRRHIVTEKKHSRATGPGGGNPLARQRPYGPRSEGSGLRPLRREVLLAG